MKMFFFMVTGGKMGFFLRRIVCGLKNPVFCSFSTDRRNPHEL